MHKNRGKTLLSCLAARTDYAMDKDKTADGELISSYECAPQTAAEEFALSKQLYFQKTGREQENDVIAYQFRQSFKPGEVTAEEANRIGYEFAERFLKGRHAFIGCTHINRHHIHNHVIWNSTTLDCSRKFRNFWNSTKAVRRLSDTICMEHGLSVIENPERKGMTYDKWLGGSAKGSNRDMLRKAIDEVLMQKPRDMDEFLCFFKDKGFAVKRGKHITLKHENFKKAIRMDSLGDGYTEEDIRAVLLGKRKHVQRKRHESNRNSLLIDIDSKLRMNKTTAKVRNLKQMAQTINYLREHGLLDLAELQRKTANVTKKYHELSDKIKSAEARTKEIGEMKTQIIAYMKTREVYDGYRKSGYSRAYYTEHEREILLHRAAKKAFDEWNLKKLPTVQSLNAEYTDLVKQKKTLYAEYSAVRSEMRELLIHKSNVERILGIDENEAKKQTEQERN
mgnify:CR=1 FL=1